MLSQPRERRVGRHERREEAVYNAVDVEVAGIAESGIHPGQLVVTNGKKFAPDAAAAISLTEVEGQ